MPAPTISLGTTGTDPKVATKENLEEAVNDALSDLYTIEEGRFTDAVESGYLATVATSGNYDDLSNKPGLASVATSGEYDDLSNKPGFADVATSGSYGDLSDTPASSLGGQHWRTETPGAISTTLTGDAEDRATYDGGSIIEVEGYGKALEITGDDVADQGQQINLAFKTPFAVEPDRIYEVRQYYVRTVDPTDPANHALRLRLKKMTADKVGDSTQVLTTDESWAVADGVKSYTFTVSKDSGLDADVTLGDTIAYIQPEFTMFGTEEAHAGAWIGVVIEDITEVEALADVATTGDMDDMAQGDTNFYVSEAELSVIQNAHLTEVVTYPSSGEVGEIVHDRDAGTFTIPRLSPQGGSNGNVQPSTTTTGDTFTWPTDQLRHFYVIDLDSNELAHTTDGDYAKDPAQAELIMVIRGNGYALRQGMRLITAEEISTGSSDATYAAGWDIKGQKVYTTAVGNDSRTSYQINNDSVSMAPLAPIGAQVTVTANDTWDLTGCPGGSYTVRFSGAGYIYAGRDSDGTELTFDGQSSNTMIQGGANAWGILHKVRDGAVFFQELTGSFTYSATSPTYDAALITGGQSIYERGFSDGMLGGLSYGLQSGSIIDAEYTGALAVWNGAVGSSAVCQEADASNHWITSANADGPNLTAWKATVTAMEAAGIPRPHILWCGGQDDAGAIASGDLTGTRFKNALYALLTEMRSFILTTYPDDDAPMVILTPPGVTEVYFDDEHDGFNRVRKAILEICTENDTWVVQGPDLTLCDRKPGDPHLSDIGAEQHGIDLSPMVANIVDSASNVYPLTASLVGRDDDNEYVEIQVTNNGDGYLLEPTGIGESGVVGGSGAPAGFAALNSAFNEIEITNSELVGDGVFRLYGDFPVTEFSIMTVRGRDPGPWICSDVFRYGARQGALDKRCNLLWQPLRAQIITVPAVGA